MVNSSGIITVHKYYSNWRNEIAAAGSAAFSSRRRARAIVPLITLRSARAESAGQSSLGAEKRRAQRELGLSAGGVGNGPLDREAGARDRERSARGSPLDARRGAGRRGASRRDSREVRGGGGCGGGQ